jgi:hypothetical protein
VLFLNECHSAVVPELKLSLISVEFCNDNIVSRDDGTPYSGADWKPEKRQPVAYVGGEKATVKASWEVNRSGDDVDDWRVRGVMSGGDDFIAEIGGPETCVTKVNREIMLSATAADLAFYADLVQYYPNFKIRWEFSFDKGLTWHKCATGVSDNMMYVTYGEPQSVMYHTPLHIGCYNASGMDEPDQIVASIWQEFSDKSVRKVNWQTGEFEGDDLRYFGDRNPRVTMESLLEHGDAWCGAWADFFFKIHALQDIAVDHVVIKPGEGHGSAFVVKNLVFNDAHDELGEFPYLWGRGHDEVVFGKEYSAQGGVPVLHSFFDHGMIRYKGRLYDPSFGGEIYESLHAWEEDRLDGYLNDDRSKIKKNDRSVTEVIVELIR